MLLLKCGMVYDDRTFIVKKVEAVLFRNRVFVIFLGRKSK
jgi:hypothetical protein